MTQKIIRHSLDCLWDLFCIGTGIGVWPRFIEPKLLYTSEITVPLALEYSDLNGFKILHFSDLHFNKRFSSRFLQKISKRIHALSPDLIVFTGDFLCHSKLEDTERLKGFLSSLHAPHGIYYIYGNHDYATYVTKGRDGKVLYAPPEKPLITKVWQRLFSKGEEVTEQKTQSVPFHEGLHGLLKGLGLNCLENRTCQVQVGQTQLNLCGLGDLWLQRCDPERAFQNYLVEYPGIVLSHNPDVVYQLKNYPGNLLLCGHTHGGQVNLPFFSNRVAPVDDPRLKRGAVEIEGTKMYISRGVGSHIPFRWFSPPELGILTLRTEQ